MSASHAVCGQALMFHLPVWVVIRHQNNGRKKSPHFHKEKFKHLSESQCQGREKSHGRSLFKGGAEEEGDLERVIID